MFVIARRDVDSVVLIGLLIIGFSITNLIVFLHVFHFLRTFVSGINDQQFLIASSCHRLHGFRQVYLGRLMRCHACMGFWVGLALYLLLHFCIKTDIINMGWTTSTFCNALGYALFQSIANFGFWLVFRRLGAEEL